MSELIQKIDCRARYDLQAPYVKIFYEIENTVQGKSYLEIVEDFYPDPLPTAPLEQFAGPQFTVNLQGEAINVLTASLVCDAINPADPNWWLRRHPKYTPWDPSNPGDNNNPIATFTIDPASIQRKPTESSKPDKGYTNESRSRSIPAWTGFKTQHVTFSANAQVTYRNGRQPLMVPPAFQCLTTNATTGEYRAKTVTQYPEPVPAGLAQNVYNAINVLQFEGEVVLQEEEVSGQLLIGNLLNITGSATAEWAGMNGLVQEVTENIDTGQTTVRFGPPKTLNAGELVDLLRVNRFRLIGFPYSMPISGTPSGGANSELDITADTPEKNSSHAEGPDQKHVVSSTVDGSGPILATTASGGDIASSWQSNTPGAGQVLISLAAANGQLIQLQQLAVCQNGVSGKITFLCGPFVPDEG
jgi:hypothetical protein